MISGNRDPGSIMARAQGASLVLSVRSQREIVLVDKSHSLSVPSNWVRL